MEPILQPIIPEDQRATALARLPSMQPVQAGDWLHVDSAFAAQLAEKARLIAARRDKVIAMLPAAAAAASELCAVVLAELAARPDYQVGATEIVRPDGHCVVPVMDDPLLTLSLIVQEDFCILQKHDSEHVLTAALLCFPAAWTLAEKLGRPLSRIHAPVAHYDAGIGARVQRMFDGVQPGRGLWRANLLRYDVPDLFQPHAEAAPRPVGDADSLFERSERQSVLRLPQTGAVVFSIHTTVVRRAISSRP